MAEYLIQDTTLDAIADAINAKTGGSSAMTPAEMVTEIGSISGGELTTQGVLTKTEPSGHLVVDGYLPSITALQYNTGVTSMFLTNFYVCGTNERSFRDMTNLVSAVVANITGNGFASGFSGCTKLKYYDTSRTSDFVQYQFIGCGALDALIIRNTSVVAMGNSNSLQNTPFWTGKAGGTIYIPKALYDHLGDGTVNDYKAATNWSTYEGYGTITWAKIEGSIYETQYADGTPIPTT